MQDIVHTVAIGEEIFKAISFWEVGEVSKQIPLRRAGFLATQLTSPQVVDGVAKLLAKSDLDRLKSKANRKKFLQAEQILSSVWDVAKMQKGQPEEDVMTVAFASRWEVACLLQLASTHAAENVARFGCLCASF